MSGPLNQEEFRVAVHVINDEERELATDILMSYKSEFIHQYDGLVTGWVDKPTFGKLLDKGFMVDRSSAAPADTFNTSSLQKETLSRWQLEDFSLESLDEAESVADEAAGDMPANMEMLVNDTDSAHKAPASLAYRIQLTGPINEEQRKLLQSLNISSLEALGSDEYLTLLTEEQKAGIVIQRFVRQVIPMQTSISESTRKNWEEAKEKKSMGGDFAEAELMGDAAPDDEEKRITYDIFLASTEQMQEFKIWLSSLADVSLIEETNRAVRLEVPEASETIEALIDSQYVLRISQFEAPELFCNTALTAIGLLDASRNARFIWNGSGEKVAVLDSGIDSAHPDLVQAVEDPPLSMPDCDPLDKVGHGTHVAGIIGGRGSQVRGVANGSTLLNVAMLNSEGKLAIPLDYNKLLGPPVERGAKILNMSWGWPIGGSYDQGSYSVDEFAYNNPDVLCVVAAGNKGEEQNGEQKYKTIGAPASAKNVITVGSFQVECDKDCPARNKKWPNNSARFAPPPIPAYSSSRGPSDYDSIKPDIVAPGVAIESARAHQHSGRLFEAECLTSGDHYACCTGTSMAAPFVSGGAAVIRQYLKNVRNFGNPSAALIKAMLIGAARDQGFNTEPRRGRTGYPDFDQGFGLLDLKYLLPHADSPQRQLAFIDVRNDSSNALASRMPVGAPIKSSRTYTFNVLNNSEEPLRAVLTWTDPPGVSVQNNMQLDLRLPEGTGIPGNNEHTFLKDPMFEQIQLNGIPFDKRNTVEVIRIKNPKAGEYRVRISAQNTSQPNQGYALVIVGNIANSTLTPI